MANEHHPRPARRAVLRSAAAGAVALVSLSACSGTSLRGLVSSLGAATTASASATRTEASTGKSTASSGSSATTPGPTATPTNQPGAIAAAFLSAWNAGQYAQMYGLISAEAQSKISKDDFVQRYTAIAREATINSVQAALVAGQRVDANIQHYTVNFDTVLVGKLVEQNTMTLAVDPNGRQWKVQWLPSLIFKELTGDNLIHMIPIGTARGNILDRTGAPLATVGTVVDVGLVPGRIKDEPAMLSQLSTLLGMPQPVIKQKYAQSQSTTRVTIKLLATAQAAPIRARLAAIPGVDVADVKARVYPHGPLASQTIGYLSEVSDVDLQKLAAKGYRPGDVLGRAGIEQSEETALAGHWGGKLLVTTRQYDPVTTIAEQAPEPAGSVTLTIDAGLQQRCEDLLGRRAGSIGVMRVSDGSLLAIASTPGFDPNQFILGMSSGEFAKLSDDPLHPFLNRVIDGQYPTGSVFKPITMAAALDHAGYTANSAFDCPGSYKLGNVTFYCWKRTGHGHIGIVSALTQSCDVAFYTMGHQEDQTNGALLPDEASGFGLGKSTQLAGLTDVAGVLPSPTWKQDNLREGWVPGDAINLSIGQGYLLATPLQVLNYYAALANGGTLWTPRIIDKVTGPNGAVTDANPAKPLGKLPASTAAADLIRNGLHGVTSDPVGTAFAAFRGLAVSSAGKTGTAQAGEGDPHAWYAAYAPFEQPEIAVVVMIEHGGEGADVAAPLARQVLQAYFGARA